MAEHVDLITRRVKTYIQKFTKFVIKNSLFDKGDRIVVALSGGPDSVFLLHLLNLIKDKWSLKIVSAHFDHLLRGKESENDAKYSNDVSKALKLEFYSGKGDVKGYAQNNKISLQEAARHLRYRFLRQIQRKTNSKYIATAHTADDQAEEILIRIIRGAGISGISGIKPKNNNIIRPVLCFAKEEILTFLKENNISFRVDSSNLKTKYLRNKIRLKLMPYLKKNFNPNIVRTLNTTADNLYHEYKFISRYIKSILKDILLEIKKQEKIVVSTSDLLKEPGNIRTGLYKAALKKAGLYSGNISSRHLLSIDNLLFAQKKSSFICLPLNVIVRKDYNNLIFERSKPVNENNASEIIIDKPGRHLLPDGKFFEIEEDSGFSSERRNFNKNKALWISSRQVCFPLILRHRQPGDRFMPLGFNCNIKLKDFFINKKIPMVYRNSLCVLTSNQEILAIAGIEISEKYKLQNKDEPSYKISII